MSGFIFLRFFAPAILGPKLFDLTTEPLVSVCFVFILSDFAMFAARTQDVGNARNSQNFSLRLFMHILVLPMNEHGDN